MKTVRIKAAAKWSGKLSVPGLHRIVSTRGGVRETEGGRVQGKSLFSPSDCPAVRPTRPSRRLCELLSFAFLPLRFIYYAEIFPHLPFPFPFSISVSHFVFRVIFLFFSSQIKNLLAAFAELLNDLTGSTVTDCWRY